METIAIIGPERQALARSLPAVLRHPPAAGGRADLLVLCPGCRRLPPLPPCRVLLLPGTLAGPLAGPRGAVSYGLGRRDTLTLSSFSRRRPCLALQRELVTLAGTCLEPQELPLPPVSPCLSPALLLAWAGACLLLGQEDLTRLPPPGPGKKPCSFPPMWL